jgi:hypothetical protein
VHAGDEAERQRQAMQQVRGTSAYNENIIIIIMLPIKP